jgi:hypothetical protein
VESAGFGKFPQIRQFCARARPFTNHPSKRRYFIHVSLGTFDCGRTGGSGGDAGRLIGHKANVAPEALVSILPGIEFMATEKLALALGVNIDLAGKNTDAALWQALSKVQRSEDVAAVKAVIGAVYFPWLEATTERLQNLVEKGSYPGQVLHRSRHGALVLGVMANAFKDFSRHRCET